jgi:CBS domain-containing protein
MSILRIAKAPTAVVAPLTTVMEAVRRMKAANVGAVVVLDGDNPAVPGSYGRAMILVMPTTYGYSVRRSVSDLLNPCPGASARHVFFGAATRELISHAGTGEESRT